MATSVCIIVVAWLITVPAVLGFARLLGRLSGPRVEAHATERRSVQDDNVVSLVPRPRNDLRRAA